MTIFKAGTTAYTNGGTGVTSGKTTNPTPPSQFTSYDEAATTGAVGYWFWTLPGDSAWQFRHLIYLDTATGTDLDLINLRLGSDASNALLVRSQGTGLMRVVGNGETSATPWWTSTTAWPLNGWYLLQGYGDAVAGTARIALCNLDGTVIAGMDTSTTKASIPQGGTGPTGIRFGKTGTASTWTGKVDWCGTEVRTGSDAAAAFIGPYTAAQLAVAGVLTPSNPQLRTVQRTLTLTASGGNGNAKTYQVDNWGDGTSSPAQSSPVFIKNYGAAVNSNIAFTVNQA